MVDNKSGMPKITQKLSQLAALFSVSFLRICLTNIGHYILSQGTEENNNAICSLIDGEPKRAYLGVDNPCPKAVPTTKQYLVQFR